MYRLLDKKENGGFQLLKRDGDEWRIKRRESINSDVSAAECPPETEHRYGPGSHPRPGERMRKRRGGCPKSNIVQGQQEREAASPKGPVPSCDHPCSHHPVLQRVSQGTCLTEPLLKRRGTPETQLLRENQSESCTAYQSPCVPTSHSRSPG